MAIYGICVDLELPMVRRFKSLNSAPDWKDGEEWTLPRRVFETTLDHVALERISDPSERVDALVAQIEAGKEQK